MSEYKLPCGCTPDASGYGYCAECTRKLREKIWRNMPKEKRDYDRKFAPAESEVLDEYTDYPDGEQGCSCHINPPCGYCTSKNDEVE